jgi:hypothetical protein
MALHILEPERATLHGQFSRDLAPALTPERYKRKFPEFADLPIPREQSLIC